MTRLLVTLVFFAVVTAACNSDGGHPAHELPIIGEREVVNGDTVYHTVSDWSFFRQDSSLVSEADLHGTPYVADFFFTSCPTVCPRVTRNMLRVYERFGDTPLKLVSFTVDPKRDSVTTLRKYAENLGVVTPEKWWFLTGDKAELYAIADDYFSIAVENSDAPGGFDHSGRIIFVDEKGQVRAFANGTDDAEVDRLIEDVDRYLNPDPDAR